MLENIPTDVLHMKMDFDVAEIHKTGIRILEELGIPLGSRKCLELLKSVGCEVDFGSSLVKIPEHVVDQALSIKRHTHKVYDRNGETFVTFGGNNLLLTSGACQIRIKEYSGEYRDSNLEDLGKFTRLHDYYDSIDIIHTPVDATELSEDIIRTKMAATVLKNTKKACWFLASEPRVVDNVFKMAVAIRGSAEDVREKPFIRIAVAPDSFLGFQKEEIELLMRCAELGIPADCEHYPIMGLTAPLSISGALAITVANFLCALVVKTTIDPANPTIFPVLAGEVNMKNAEIVTASPTIWLYYVAGIKMGQFYDMPTSVLTSSDAKDVDIQMTYEKAFGHFISASAGANNIFDATGSLDSMNLASYEDVVIELELLDSLIHYLKGFTVESHEKDFEMIQRAVENKMLFLDDEHTFSNYKDFLWNANIFVKDNFEKWEKSGALSIMDRAHKKAEEILEHHAPPELPREVVREIDDIVLQAGKQKRD